MPIIDTDKPTLPDFTVDDLRSSPDQFISKLNSLVDIVQVLVDNRDN